MLALTAGGASGLVAVSHELGGDDRVVAVVQYLRVGIVTATMPLIAALGYGATAGGSGPRRPAAPCLGSLAFLVVCAAVGLGLARLARVPAGGCSARWPSPSRSPSAGCGPPPRRRTSSWSSPTP